MFINEFNLFDWKTMRASDQIASSCVRTINSFQIKNFLWKVLKLSGWWFCVCLSLEPLKQPLRACCSLRLFACVSLCSSARSRLSSRFVFLICFKYANDLRFPDRNTFSNFQLSRDLSYKESFATLVLIKSLRAMRSCIRSICSGKFSRDWLRNSRLHFATSRWWTSTLGVATMWSGSR